MTKPHVTPETTWDRIGAATGWRRALRKLDLKRIKRRWYPDEERLTVYQFGVFSGGSICELHRVFAELGLPLRSVFGFDSFEGLPPSTDEEARESIHRFGEYQWSSGDFNSVEFLGVDDPRALLNETFKRYLDARVELIPGWFSDTLTAETAERYGMGPALYIDLDADIYSATYEALEFVITQGIAVPGTLVAYDDWGGSPGWKSQADGASKAHADISRRYGLGWKLLRQVGRSYPHVGRIYLLKKIKRLIPATRGRSR